MTEETVPISPAQADSMLRLLLQSGDITPMGARQLRKLWYLPDEEEPNE